MWKSLADALPELVRDVVGLCGAALVSYGAYMIFPASGFIAGGLMLIAGAAYSAVAKG